MPDAALAFQLEINRMKDFDLEAIPTTNRRITMYLGRSYARPGQPSGSSGSTRVRLVSASSPKRLSAKAPMDTLVSSWTLSS